MSDPRPSSRHLDALDGIRGLAVLMVLLHNLNALSDTEGLARRLYDIASGVGWLGVQLFFVLSGFLITGILIDTRDSDRYYTNFVVRRALRIFPLYYAFLFGAFVLVPYVVGHPLPQSEHQLWLWLYIENWVAPFGREVEGLTHFWSLSIEEQFYLVWPFVVLYSSRRRLWKVGAWLVAVALVSRVVLLFGTDLGPEAPYMFTVCRMDALAFGAMAAIAYRDEALIARFVKARGRIRWAAVVLLVVAGLATKGAPRVGVLTQTYGFTLFGLLAAVVVLDAAIEREPDDWLLRAWSWAPLRSVGKYSYAMYVFHLPMHLAFGHPMLVDLVGEDIGVGIAAVYFVVGSAATYVAALASYHALEKRFSRLKARFSA